MSLRSNCVSDIMFKAVTYVTVASISTHGACQSVCSTPLPAVALSSAVRLFQPSLLSDVCA